MAFFLLFRSNAMFCLGERRNKSPWVDD